MKNKTKRAYLANYDKDQFSAVGRSYIRACILIISAIESGKPKDFEKRQLLFPLIYNFRHAAELFLKSVMLHVGIKFRFTHDLSDFLSNYSQKLEEFFESSTVPHACKKYYDNFKKEVESISNGIFAGKKIINERDLKNEFFRYPHKKHEQEFENRKDINLAELKVQINRLLESFYFLYSVMSTTIVWKR